MIAELTARALEDKAGIVATTRTPVSSEADPTPFVAAFLARDVIAPAVLVGRNLALGAGLDVVLSRKGAELSITDVGAADPAVVDCAASHANLLPAGTLGAFTQPVSPPYVVHASDSRTPTQVRVQVDVDVHLEAHVLLENVLRPELLHIVFLELSLTVMLHARDLDNLPIDDVVLEML